jgi:hypothetical protein
MCIPVGIWPKRVKWSEWNGIWAKVEWGDFSFWFAFRYLKFWLKYNRINYISFHMSPMVRKYWFLMDKMKNYNFKNKIKNHLVSWFKILLKKIFKKLLFHWMMDIKNNFLLDWDDTILYYYCTGSQSKSTLVIF